jgi:DNA-binding protein H-NS
MAKMNLKSMSAGELIDLRGQVDSILAAKVKAERGALEAALSKLDTFGSAARGRRAKQHALAGRKVAAKYKGANGETWSGRGLKPRWLTEALKSGKKIEDFLIGNSGAGRGRKVRRAAKR